MSDTSTSSSNRLSALASALVGLQADLKSVDKSAANPFFKSKYAPLPEVRDALQPLLAKHKLALIAVPAIVGSDEANGLKFYLMHESGENITGEWKLNPVKNDPQAMGSATTYLRRYGDMAMTGLVADEDDDGNTASGRGHHTTPSSAQSAPQASPNNPASVKQLALINSMLVEAGYDDDAIRARVAKIKSSADASELISKLKEATS